MTSGASRVYFCLPILLILLLGSSAHAFLGLNIGDHRFLFLEPSLNDRNDSPGGSLDVHLPDLRFEHLEGLIGGGSYGITVSSLGEGIQARRDRYRLRAGFRPGSLKLFGGPLRLGFGMDAGAKLQMLRHFHSGKEALKALPLEPWLLRSTDRILERLQPGDMVDVPIHANLLLKASLTTPIAGIPVKPGIFLKVGGSFRMTLLRQEEQKVRLRFFSFKNISAGAKIKAGFVWDAELIELLGEKVQILSEFSLVKAKWIETWGRGMLLDATLDLGDPQGRRAFESLFYQPLRLASGGKKLLSVGWALVQDIAEKQANRDPEDRAAVLHSCGLVKYREGTKRLKLGNSLLQYGRKSYSALLEFAPQEESGPRIFLASSLTAGKSTFLLRRQQKWLSESLVYGRETPGAVRAGLWTLRYRLKDRRFSERNLKSLRRRTRYLLGPDLAPVLPDLKGPRAVPAKAEIKVQLARKALEELLAIPVPTLQVRLDTWVAQLGAGRLWRTWFGPFLKRLPEALHEALATALKGGDKEALRALANLRRRNQAFREVGSGFLLSLLHPRKDDDRLAVYFKYKSSEKIRVVLKLGNLAQNPSEFVLPILRFLERGLMALENEAATIAVEYFTEQEEASPRDSEVPTTDHSSRDRENFLKLYR
jgi:hypothetical protein